MTSGPNKPTKAHPAIHSLPDAPSPEPFLRRSLDDALAALALDSGDRHELRQRVAAMGLPDPVLKERVGVDRLNLPAAAAAPLLRTPPGAIPAEGERPSLFVETCPLPSGRVVQLRRRFPSAAELDAVLLRGAEFDEPSLWIREILPENGSPLPPTVEAIGALTVKEQR